MTEVSDSDSEEEEEAEEEHEDNDDSSMHLGVLPGDTISNEKPETSN